MAYILIWAPALAPAGPLRVGGGARQDRCGPAGFCKSLAVISAEAPGV